jgi:hypothetical protein
MEFLVILAVLMVVVLFVTAPLRTERTEPASGGAEVAELLAAREAKYREIRDAELDHRTGKLSDGDFEAIDRALRADAAAILRKLDRVNGAGGNGATSATIESR